MKKLNFFVVLCLVLLFSFTPVYSKVIKKTSNIYTKPFSFNFSFSTGSNFFIYIPTATFFLDISGMLGIAFAWEYRFAPEFALENGFLLYGAGQYTNTQYIYKKVGKHHTIELVNADIFFQYLISLKFYFPEKPIHKKYKFMIRLGWGYEIWPLSYYFFFDNKQLSGNGFLFASKLHGPNIFDDYIKYRDIHNFINIGIHAGFGPKILLRKDIAFIPELRYTFFCLPVRDGNKVNPKINGVNTFFVRNDGTDKRKLSDFKMMVEFSFTWQFYKGLESDNLVSILKKQKEDEKKRLEAERKRQLEMQKKKNIRR